MTPQGMSSQPLDCDIKHDLDTSSSSPLNIPATPRSNRSISLSQPPRPHRSSSQRARALTAKYFEDNGLLDSQASDSQAINHLLQDAPLPGCEHLLLATADIMGIPLASDRLTPPPGLRTLESDEEQSQVIADLHMPDSEEEEEQSQVLDPIESQYPTSLAQMIYDRGEVSLDWLIQNMRYPHELKLRDDEIRSNVEPSNSTIQTVVRHPSPAIATPRQPPSTEPTRRQTLVLSAQERETVIFFRELEQRKLQRAVKTLTSTVGVTFRHDSDTKGKGKGKAVLQ